MFNLCAKVSPVRYKSDEHGPTSLGYIEYLARLIGSATPFFRLVLMGGATLR